MKSVNLLESMVDPIKVQKGILISGLATQTGPPADTENNRHFFETANLLSTARLPAGRPTAYRLPVECDVSRLGNVYRANPDQSMAKPQRCESGAMIVCLAWRGSALTADADPATVLNCVQNADGEIVNAALPP